MGRKVRCRLFLKPAPVESWCKCRKGYAWYGYVFLILRVLHRSRENSKRRGIERQNGSKRGWLDEKRRQPRGET
jgi:hypothetical protein